MSAEHKACAYSAAVEHWGQIDWKRCEWQVARLQARIVKASRMGRWENGFLKEISKAVSTTSVIDGFLTMYLWTQSSLKSGYTADSSKTRLGSPPKRVLLKGELSLPLHKR